MLVQIMQDDGTVGDEDGPPKAIPSPGSVSLGTDSSDDEDDEDGDGAEHRVNVRTGQHPKVICTVRLLTSLPAEL